MQLHAPGNTGMGRRLRTSLFALLFGLFTISSLVQQCHALSTEETIDIANRDDNEENKAWTPEFTVSDFNAISTVLQFEDSQRSLLLSSDGVYLTKDSGKNWIPMDFNDDDGKPLEILNIQEFEYFPQRAFVFTKYGKTFYTMDQGETWSDFNLNLPEVINAYAQVNYANPDYILLQYIYSSNYTIVDRVYYSRDGLRSAPVEMNLDNTGDCTFTKLSPFFTEGADETILCIRRNYNHFNVLVSDEVVTTKDFFKNIMVSGDSHLDNAHVLNVKVVKGFIVLIVSTDRYLVDSTNLFISKDGVTFFRANFEGQRNGWMFSVLDSTEDALYVSVYGRGNTGLQMSSDIYRSDSQGRNFKKLFGDIFSNMLGMSLISKVQTLDGVWVASHNEQYHNFKAPSSKSMITYDDGENWTFLNITDSPNCKNDKDCSLHIAWMTQRSGDGEIVTGETPGILIGVGNVGKYLEHDVTKLSSFISRDGGLTWRRFSDRPTVFAFGDLGNVIVTCPVDLNYLLKGKTKNPVDFITYSLDQGDTWTEIKLDGNLVPAYFVNNKDNTDKKFMLLSYDPLKNLNINRVSTFDFTSAFDKTCSGDDMEEWFARVDPITKEQTCVYGHSEKFNRRKYDAKCFVNKNYDDLKVIEKPCECTIKDTECNYGFAEDENNECQPNLGILATLCESTHDTIKMSKRRKIPGNLCENGFQPSTDDYELKCKNAKKIEDENAISVRFTSFEEDIVYYQYLEKNLTKVEYQEETLVVLTASRKAYLSYDSEKFQPLYDASFVSIFTNPYFPDSIYFVADNGEILSSLDRGKTMHWITAPYTSTGYSSYSMSFDKRSAQTYILISNINCDSSNNCQTQASVTENNGETFTDLVADVSNCVFAESVFDSQQYSFSDTEIICTQKVANQPYFRLITSSDSFSTDPKVAFEKTIGFAVSSKYLVVAVLNDNNTLTAYVTVDGTNFAPMKFPHDVNLDMQTAYTVLDVNSDQLFLHLTTYDEAGREYGALLKSNYNGTLFTTAINYVNRNTDAYVDFESVRSLEGLSVVNVVMNPDDVQKGQEKKLVSMISHNDAATWFLLPPPQKDVNGKKYNCKGCSLHLHSYTERLDPSRDSFSSASALGLMFGLGNVGTTLGDLKDTENLGLYFTKDAGLSWKEVAKGKYMWEFGDQGTVLVIVEGGAEVNALKYSLDLGETWREYVFSPDKKYLVEDIATVPSDNSLKFILIVKGEGVTNDILTVDFTNVYSRQCDLPMNDEKDIGDDYEYYTPKHPGLKENCLFGHEKKYLRRKADRDCFIGLAPLYLGSVVVNNCECTREDYECDYNYELAIDGTCKLVKGLQPLKGDEICSKDDVNEWWEPTGYRKLETTTCEGGVQFDKRRAHACPGKKLEKVGISGWMMFWVMFIPFLVFAVAMVFIYERGVRRNGGFSRLGEIRLDEGDNLHLVEENGVDKVVNVVIRFGVFSYQLMGRGFRIASKLFSNLTGRDTSYQSSGSMGAFFNDMVDDDHSLFGDLNDDEDAREIDDFLEHGLGEDHVDDEDFDNFVSHDGDATTPGHTDQGPAGNADNSEFQLSDDETEI